MLWTNLAVLPESDYLDTHLHFIDSERPCVVQLGGADPAELVKTAQMIVDKHRDVCAHHCET